MQNTKLFLPTTGNGIARAVWKADGEWSVEVALSKQDVRCLAADPLNTDVIYAGTQGNGVLRSTDRGQTWQPAGLSGHIIKAIAISPIDRNAIYVGTKPALIFASYDGGNTWTELAGFRRIPNRWWWFSPAEPPDHRPYIFAIAPSPTEPEVLLAGVEAGAVVRSEDGGRTWSRHRRGALRDCHSLKFHAANRNWVYEAGGTGGGAALSRDGGRTFQKAKRGLAEHYGIVCAADPATPEIWYVCVGPPPSPFSLHRKNTGFYLYRSTGETGWQPIGWTSHPLPVAPTALVTLPNVPGHLYAGLTNGDVWQSADYGDTWEQLPFKFNLQTFWFSMLVI